MREIHVVEEAAVGLYRKLRASLKGVSATLWDVVTMRCVDHEPGALRFHLQLHTHKSIPLDDGSGGIVVEANAFLECERVMIVENLRQNWTDTVGVDTLPLMEALLETRVTQFWAVPDFERFIEVFGHEARGSRQAPRRHGTGGYTPSA